MTRRPPDLEGIGHARRLRVQGRENPVTDDVLTGPWRAWKARLRPQDRLEWPLGLDRWFIHAPGAHPLWDWHTLSGCALRDHPGLPPAKLARPDMTHEIAIEALDPSWEVVVDPDDTTQCGRHRLRPANVVHQLVLTDELAKELQFLLVRAIVTGLTSPDEDFRAHNRDLLDATAAHLRQGLHIPS